MQSPSSSAQVLNLGRTSLASVILLIIFFFFSGVSGLIYEVIWFKQLAVIWGNSTLATGAVTAAFMLGLSIGAWIIGRLADRTVNGLQLYGALELLIAAIASVIPMEFQLIEEFASRGYDSLSPNPVLHTAVRVGYTFIVLGPPCMMMGGTLPLMTVWLSRSENNPADRVTGLLYGINTLGAASGVLLAGFFLLPNLGTGMANLVAISLNLIVGVSAIAIGRRQIMLAGVDKHPSELTSRFEFDSACDALKRDLSGREFTRVEIERPVASLWGVYTASFLSGFAALNLETSWIRQLLLVLGASTYAFSSILTMMLLGIATGSLAYCILKYSDFGPRRQWMIFAVIAGVVGSSYLGQRLIPTLAGVVGALSSFRNTDFGNATVCLLASGLISFIPAFGMGMLMPLIAREAQDSSLNIGHRLGLIYGLNTFGCIFGATIGSAAIIPWFGTWTAFVISCAAYVITAHVLETEMRRAEGLTRTVTLAIGLSVMVVAGNPVSILPLNLGQYMYGRVAGTDSEILLFKEGASTNILVTRSASGTALRVNGKVDASSFVTDMQTQLALAYFPRIFKPNAREILVIGFGSGTTTGASLLFPDTRVTCCELEPAVVQAAVHFSSFNHSPHKSPNFRAVYDDARGFLQGTRSLFDMIISEPSNPWMDGVAALYTVEHFRASKRRLKPGGAYVQWVQTYNLQPQDYSLIVRTFKNEFRHCVVLVIQGGDTLLVGSDDSLELSGKTLSDAQRKFNAIPEICRDLRTAFNTADIRSLLLEHFMLDNAEVAALLQVGAGVNTDRNMRLAFDAPRRLFQHIPQTVHQLILSKINIASVRNRFRNWDCGVEQLPSLMKLYSHFAERSDPDSALQLMDLGLSIDPSNSGFLVNQQLLRITRKQPPQGVDRSKVTLIAKRSASEANRLGVELWKLRRHELAVAVFEELVQVHPGSFQAWENLAINYKALGKGEQAAVAFARAYQIDPCQKKVSD